MPAMGLFETAFWILLQVRMMLIPSRMLIFDEPTNHLDVPMKACGEVRERRETMKV